MILMILTITMILSVTIGYNDSICSNDSNDSICSNDSNDSNDSICYNDSNDSICYNDSNDSICYNWFSILRSLEPIRMKRIIRTN